MTKETATVIKNHAMNAISQLGLILNNLPSDLPEEDLATIKRGIGLSIGTIQMDLLEVVNMRYPELDDLNRL